MFDLGSLIHFGSIGLAVGVNALGSGIGEGIVGYAAIKASNRQPQAHPDIMRVALLGSALIETVAIIGIFVSGMLFLETPSTYYHNLGQLGIACAICIPGLVIGIVSALPIQEAVHAVARQPFFSQRILGFTIVTQALIQTPMIFSFIISLIIHKQLEHTDCLAESLRTIASGLCVGLGSIGPAIGLAIFAKTSCQAIGLHHELYRPIFSFTLISATLIETPVIFAFLISLIILLFIPNLEGHQTLIGIACIAAALSTGLGTFGPAISSGKIAGAACKAITQSPENKNIISRTCIFIQAFIETGTIYAVLLSIFILFMAHSL